MIDHPIALVLAADHGGFALKEQLKPWLRQFGEVKDFGANELDPADDYPDFGIPAARFVAEDVDHRRGVFVCGSGQGMAMVANKVPGVRALVVAHVEDFSNDEAANVLSLAGRSLTEDQAKEIVTRWLDSLETPLAERHQRRIEKITALDR